MQQVPMGQGQRRWEFQFLFQLQYFLCEQDLCTGAVVRVVSHKLITMLAAPIVANSLVWWIGKLSEEQKEAALLFMKSVLPSKLHPLVLTSNFLRMVLTVACVVCLGNLVSGMVDSLIGITKASKKNDVISA